MPVFAPHVTRHRNHVLAFIAGEVCVAADVPKTVHGPVELEPDSHALVTPVPDVAVCKDKFTVPPGTTLAEEDTVFPGAGVPVQATGAATLKI